MEIDILMLGKHVRITEEQCFLCLSPVWLSICRAHREKMLSLFFMRADISFEPEVMSGEMQDAIRNSLVEAHEKAEIYVKDPNVANAEEACMTNRKAIVYLYLVRSGYREIIGEQEFKKFRTHINRTIYQNRLLQQSDAIKGGKGKEGSDYLMLEKHSASERRRLRLLQAIIDNDIQEAQVLLQITIITAITEQHPLAFHGSSTCKGC